MAINMSERKYSYTEGRLNKYKYHRTSNFDGAVAIFIKKRFLGFLWWVFVKDKFGSPINFNKQAHAEAFMEGVISYENRIDSEYKWVDNKMIEIVHVLTDKRAIDKIVQKIFEQTGEVIDSDCARAAWILDGKQYVHRAIDFAKLWNNIYKFNGKKLWENLLQNH
jgi:hypothetical protein